MSRTKDKVRGAISDARATREPRVKPKKFTLKQIEKVCKKWGGLDDWGVPEIYIGTLLKKLDELEES